MATSESCDNGTSVLLMKRSFIDFQSEKGDQLGEGNVHQFPMREIEGKRKRRGRKKKVTERERKKVTKREKKIK